MKATLSINMEENYEVDDILDRVAKQTGGSCMAIIPKKYENRKVKVLILKDDSNGKRKKENLARRS